MDLSGAGQTRAAVLPGLAAAGYAPHPALHGPQAVWGEKNCYVDLWIELLHTLGAEPLALWPFALEIDFEGDQWTFFKPPTTALRRLYGIDVQELTPWRPLAAQAIEHLAAGRWLSIEADAYWLPDVAGTDYRRHHAKTTIVLNDVDLQARRLGYFHNAGYFALDGEDFARLFHLADTDGAAEPARLPLFAEFIRAAVRQARLV